MTVKIRLAKIGKKNAPTFRVVVTKQRSKRNGKFIDIIGFFNPHLAFEQSKIDEVKLDSWVSNGAQMTDAVKKLLEGKSDYKKYDPKKAQENKEASPETSEA